MNTDLLLWPLSILLLWTPSAAMFSPTIREKLRNPIRRRDEGIVSLLRCRLNWADLVRSAIGGWLVNRAVHSYISSQDDIATVYMVAQYSVLTLAVVAQTLWIDRPIRIIGPVFFLTGLTLAVSGPTIGGFALLLGFTCALMLRRLSLGFIFVPCSLVGFAMLFREVSAVIFLNALVFALPMVLAFAFGARIAYARRPNGHPSRGYNLKKNLPEAPLLEEPKEVTVVPHRFRTSREKALAYAEVHSSENIAAGEVLELGLPQHAAGQSRSA